jgi:hypothetical protein
MREHNGWLSGQREIAEYCRMCIRTFLKHKKEIPIPMVKVGAIWKTTPEILDEWLKKISKA